MTTLDEWTAEVSAALGLDPRVLDRDAVLDLTKDVAHNVARPAAPLTAYLLGVAVGRANDGDAAALAAKVRALIPPATDQG
ncbi:MAG: hypothetical protein QOC82_233 [Frankiaceae bacterium]|jgi:hypothetical protein|nr:hypothetical protein [Frankiaceae bacterium]